GALALSILQRTRFRGTSTAKIDAALARHEATCWLEVDKTSTQRHERIRGRRGTRSASSICLHMAKLGSRDVAADGTAHLTPVAFAALTAIRGGFDINNINPGVLYAGAMALEVVGAVAAVYIARR